MKHTVVQPTSVYRPYRTSFCQCEKVRVFKTEAEARAAAESEPDTFGPNFRVYRCSGTKVWHIATRGFHPRQLKSSGRIFAWTLKHDRVINPVRTIQKMRLGRRAQESLTKMIEYLVINRLATLTNDGCRLEVNAGGDAVLLRICEVGWDGYREETSQENA